MAALSPMSLQIGSWEGSIQCSHAHEYAKTDFRFQLQLELPERSSRNYCQKQVRKSRICCGWFNKRPCLTSNHGFEKYHQQKYEYPVRTEGGKQVARIVGFQRNSVGWHCANRMIREMAAMTLWATVIV